MLRKHLALFNRLLLIANIAIASYLVVWPILPELEQIIFRQFDQSKGYVYASKLAQTQLSVDEIANLAPIPENNTLVIPKIGVDAKILSGSDKNLLNQGIWHRPLTDTPLTGGNMVLTGHRFQYLSGPNTFYHLDKLGIGDNIIVYWQGIEYDYTVSEIKIVDPNATWIEAPTPESQLTLYTCTPLWTAAKRLVIIAKPNE